MPMSGAGGKGDWHEAIQARVWPRCVVVDPPGFDDPTRCRQTGEQVLIEMG
jgi:hypothetical protein